MLTDIYSHTHTVTITLTFILTFTQTLIQTVPTTLTLRLMTHTAHCIFTAILSQYRIMNKTLCISVEKQFTHTCVECTTTMGGALIDLVHQYPDLWDKKMPSTKTAIIKMLNRRILLEF